MPINIGSPGTTFNTLVPDLETDVANIQTALKFYHYGNSNGSATQVSGQGVWGFLTDIAADVSTAESSLSALTAQVATNTPSGVVNIWAGATAPTGWLLCDGSSKVREDYASLFSAIGTTYGSADSTHFNLPNLKGRVPVGLDSTQTEFDTLGETGGAKTVTLTSAQMPVHSHTPTLSTDSAGTPTGTIAGVGNHDHAASSNAAGSHNHSFTDDGTGTQSVVTSVSGASYSVGIAANDQGTSQNTSTNGSHTHTINISVAGAHTHGLTMNQMSGHTHTVTIADAGGTDGVTQAHNNLQPYIVMNYIIKA
jgi:microcystin-dependent protein